MLLRITNARDPFPLLAINGDSSSIRFALYEEV